MDRHTQASDGDPDPWNTDSDAGLGDGDDFPGNTQNGSDGGPDGRGDASVVGQDGEWPHNPDDPCGGREVLAHDLSIQQIALYQTVKIPLMENGAWIQARSIPLVQGKRSLLRVFFAAGTAYQPHAVRAKLTLTTNGVPKTFVETLFPTGSSTDATLSSTVNFELEGAELGPDTTLRVALLETACAGTQGNGNARFPATGAQPLEAEPVGKLRVVIVPVRNNGLVPDASPSQIARIRETLRATYPVSDVEVTVGSVLDWTGRIVTASLGWSDLLGAIVQKRAADAPDRDVYYYGLITPRPDFSSYCGRACTLGVAHFAENVVPRLQVGVGIGFPVQQTYDTIVHELAHIHGRRHAPSNSCGAVPEGVDPSFPASDGTTSAWGWNATDHSLVSPTTFDVMGYCGPTWLSEYTYKGLLTRSRSVNATFKSAGQMALAYEWTSFLLYGDGRARWFDKSTEQPEGRYAEAEVQDADGITLGQVVVNTIEVADTSDAFLYVGDLPESWAKLVLSDRTLVRADILPALVY